MTNQRSSEHTDHSALRRRMALTGTGALVLGGVTPISALLVTESAAAVNGALVVTDFTDDVGSPEVGSLREAIAVSGPGDVITFDLGDDDEATIELEGFLEIKHALTIQGPGQGKLTIDGGGEDDGGFSMFIVDPSDGGSGAVTISGAGDPAAVIISDLTLANGRSSVVAGVGGYGGAIVCDNPADIELVVAEVTFDGNVAEAAGGAIDWFDCGDLTITDSEFVNNRAGQDGGAIAAHSVENITISGSTFTGNEAEGDGGAIDGYEFGDLTITDSEFVNNRAQRGGAVAAYYVEHITVSGSAFTGNEAEERGGAIWAAQDRYYEALSGTVTISDGTTFTGNLTDFDLSTEPNFLESGGGAVSFDGFEQISISDAHFEANVGLFGGAGIIEAETVEISQTSVSENESVVGGGLLIGAETVTVSGSMFDSNCGAYIGGGLASYGVGDEPTLTVQDTEFRGNEASYGGGIGMLPALSGPGFNAVEVTVTGSTFAANQATYGSAFSMVYLSGDLPGAVGDEMVTTGDSVVCALPSGPGALEISGSALGDLFGGESAMGTLAPSVPSGTVHFTDTAIVGNEGLASVVVTGDRLTITDSVFAENLSYIDVYAGVTEAEVSGSAFFYNAGGAMYVGGFDDDSSLSVADTWFVGNGAVDSGNGDPDDPDPLPEFIVLAGGVDQVALSGSVFAVNRVATSIFATYSEQLTISDSAFVYNMISIDDDNGDNSFGNAMVRAQSETVLIEGSVFTDNEGSSVLAIGPVQGQGSSGAGVVPAIDDETLPVFQLVDSLSMGNRGAVDVIANGFVFSEVSGSTFTGVSSEVVTLGLFSLAGSLVANSTFSDNQAGVSALLIDGPGGLLFSTITGTTTDGDAPAGGVLFGFPFDDDLDDNSASLGSRTLGAVARNGTIDDDGPMPSSLVIGSVVSGNGGDGVPDIAVISDADSDAAELLEVVSSVVGSVVVDDEAVEVSALGTGNVVADDPELGPLEDNGGIELLGDLVMPDILGPLSTASLDDSGVLSASRWSALASGVGAVTRSDEPTDEFIVIPTRLPAAGSPALGLAPQSLIDPFDDIDEIFATDLRFDQRGVGFDRVVDRDGSRVSDAGALTVQDGASPSPGPGPGPGPGPDVDDGFVSVEPVRLFDSRGSGPLEPGVPVAVPLVGVPADAAAVVVNVTVVGASGEGFVTVFPCGVTAPNTSNANFVGISTVAGNVISAIGEDGTVCVQLGQVSGDVLVDVMGYFTAGTYAALVPERVYDSRDGVGVIAAGETVRVRLPEAALAGAGDVVAAAVNVTAANATGDGFFSVWNCDGPVPGTSNGNFVGVSTIANNVVTALGDGGELCVQLGQSDANVIVDLMGLVLADSGYVPLGAGGRSSGPSRVFDSRGSMGRESELVAPGETVRVELDDVVGDVGAVVVNVTAANATGDGFFTVWNCDGPVPGTSNGNFVGVSTIANNVVVGVDDGAICVQLGQSSAHVIVDVFGSFAPDAVVPTRRR